MPYLENHLLGNIYNKNMLPNRIFIYLFPDLQIRSVSSILNARDNYYCVVTDNDAITLVECNSKILFYCQEGVKCVLIQTIVLNNLIWVFKCIELLINDKINQSLQYNYILV